MDSEEPLVAFETERLSETRRTLKLEICFDGAEFSGWQAQRSQPEVRTIQGEIESAIRSVTGQTASLLGCGRTDAGVSALRQVATFHSDTLIPAEKLTLALNANLPPEIRILRVTDVPSSFHPIADVVRKRYRYLLSDSRPVFPFLKDHVWFTRKKFDVSRMKEAASHLLGTHDFAAFQTTGSPRESTVRTIYEITFAEHDVPEFWSQRRPNELPAVRIHAVEVEADGFLYNMVRAIVGTLVLFGERHAGFEDPLSMKTILESKNRASAGPTAPAGGLLMLEARYEEEENTGG